MIHILVVAGVSRISFCGILFNEVDLSERSFSEFAESFVLFFELGVLVLSCSHIIFELTNNNQAASHSYSFKELICFFR